MGPRQSQASAQASALLRLDGFRCSDLPWLEEPGIDRVLRSGASGILRSFTNLSFLDDLCPYVQVTLDRCTKRTESVVISAVAEAEFTQPLFFTLSDVPEGDSPPDIVTLTFAVRHRSRKLKHKLWHSDEVLGQACLSLEIHMNSCRGTSTARLELSKPTRLDPCGALTVKYSLLHMAGTCTVLSSFIEAPSEQSPVFSLVRLTRVVMTLLRSPQGIDLLLKTRPRELRSRSREKEEAGHRKLEEVIESLCLHAEAATENCSDAEMMKRLRVFSRSILNFIKDFASADSNVVGLAQEWIRAFFIRYSQAHFLRSVVPALDEDRVRRFLVSAQVQVEDLEAVDKSGCVHYLWHKTVDGSEQSWWAAAQTVEWLRTPLIGEGTFGCVWRARDRHTGMQYAIKNVRVPSAGSFQAEIAKRELELLNHICMEQHPCIVELFFSGSSANSKLYVHVMEYCPGGDLAHKIVQASSSCLPYAPRKVWIGQIFLALEHLHMIAGVLHRDIKPENVVFDDQGVAKLTDFGVSRFGDSCGEWSFGFPPGTSLYISPEVFLGRNYNHKADLYSFGVLVWLILSGGIADAHNLNEVRPPVANETKLNWKALFDAIHDPVGQSAPPLHDSNAADLVLQLTQEDAEMRPSHETVREHAFMSSLRLPGVRAGFDATCQWVEAHASHPDVF